MRGVLRKTATGGARAGLALTPGGLALAVATREPTGPPVLARCELLPLGAARDAEAVAAALRGAGLGSLPASTIMDPEEYQLAIVQAPDVPPAELRAAMRWRLRELIDYPVDDAVIDIVDLPAASRRDLGRTVYAITARRTAVERRAAAFRSLPGFDVIDIPELALRNLAAILPVASRGVALLHVDAGTVTLVLLRGGTFYFARRMALPVVADRARGTLDVPALALELQRSLDYYERNHDQPAMTNVVIAPAGEASRTLAAALAAETGLAVDTYDLNELCRCPAPLDPAVQAACLLAVGAALRDERRSL